MKEYLMKTITALICLSLLSSFLPKEGAGKNVLFCARILAVLLILSPIVKLRGIDTERIFSFETESLEMMRADFQQDAFCETLKERIEEMLLEKGEHVTVTVYAKTDESGNILGVSAVEVNPYTEKIKKEIATILEMEETQIRESGT